MTPQPAAYHRHRFPAEIISHAVWLYHVFSLSLRDVELIRFDRGGVAELLTDLERMAAQCLGALSGLHRQKMRQHASRHAIRHEGGKMRTELVQLRCRPTMRRPADARLGAATV